MEIGFTGTQEGMTDLQYQGVQDLVFLYSPTKVHHGMCKGADKQFHDICRSFGTYIVGHPGINFFGDSPLRANCDVDEIEPELPYLERNSNIVNWTDILIATPKEFSEVVRSGTWSTIRRARKINHPVTIIYPDGSQ